MAGPRGTPLVTSTALKDERKEGVGQEVNDQYGSGHPEIKFVSCPTGGHYCGQSKLFFFSSFFFTLYRNDVENAGWKKVKSQKCGENVVIQL